MDTETKTTYTLEMLHSSDLRPVRVSLPGLRIERMQIPFPEYSKFLHTVVGSDYRWGGRSDWGKDKWTAYASREELHTWVAHVDGTPAGYCEMEKSPEGDVEIKSFGLLSAFIGQGLGGHLLTVAVERAWAPTGADGDVGGGMGATRVWLHTCTHDHPHALDNYIARGFRVCKTEVGPANRPIPSFWDLVEGCT
jgi:ribosomal protein S18 acetylase RimI-like enzyme